MINCNCINPTLDTSQLPVQIDLKEREMLGGCTKFLRKSALYKNKFVLKTRLSLQKF